MAMTHFPPPFSQQTFTAPCHITLHAVRLDLVRTQMSGTLPTEIGHLTKLGESNNAKIFDESSRSTRDNQKAP